MRKYESLFILHPDLEEEQVRASLGEFSATIEQQGGNVTGLDVWGLRRLEYPIKRQDSGHYAVVNFESEPPAVKELEQMARIRDDVLRIKTVQRETGQ